MRRISTFVFGMIVGAILLAGAQKYHVLHSHEGLHLIPKTNATLSKTYVDIRRFTLRDWAKNADIALALRNANKHELIGNAAGNALENGLDQWLQGGSSEESH